MTSEELYYQILVGVFIAAAVAFVVLLLIDAPYGKHDRDGWGPGINVRLGWFLLELPSFAFFLYFFSLGEHRLAIVPLILFLMYEVHYFHRTFIYPLTLRVKPGAREKVVLLLLGIPFNAANGYLNGFYISHYGDHLHRFTWLSDPRFIFGFVLFFLGFALNKHSDKLLRNLRKPGETGYKIPQGGGFRFVSCPNYLGELIQWTGFAIACWSPAGAAFVLFTAANLVPRALASHRWYKEQFTDYPADRKAVIPWLL
jgi:protein-S-isoprenylcysteine O-methyltransferase Ste14